MINKKILGYGGWAAFIAAPLVALSLSPQTKATPEPKPSSQIPAKVVSISKSVHVSKPYLRRDNFLVEWNQPGSIQKRLNRYAKILGPEKATVLSASFKVAFAAPLYQIHQNRNNTGDGALASLVAQNLIAADDGLGDKATKIQLVRNVFAITSKGTNADVANHALDYLAADKKAETTSFDRETYAAFEAALKVEKNAAKKKGKIKYDFVKPVSVHYYIPDVPLNAPLVLNISYEDKIHIANVCYAEAASLKSDDGIRSCAAVVLNRLANGRFGATVDAVLLSGKFEALDKVGRNFNKLERAPNEIVALVDEVIEKHMTYGGVTFFLNPYTTKKRNTNFAAEINTLQTIRLPHSFICHVLTDGRHIVRKEKGMPVGSVELYKVPNYIVNVAAPLPIALKTTHSRKKRLQTAKLALQ